MIYQLSIPAAVAGVTEVRILEWHGEPSTAYAVGDLIVELETHKAVVEVRAGQPGFLREQRATEGEWREIGAVLALFSDQADETLDGSADAADLPVEFEVT